jgi:hypothetical protein
LKRIAIGAIFLPARVASIFLGAFPPVDLRAVCLVRAIADAIQFVLKYRADVETEREVNDGNY